MPVRPAAYANNQLSSFWHTDYFLSAYRYNNSPSAEIPPSLLDLVTTYDAIANDPELFYEMEFEVGDLQLISNHITVHSRTAFTEDDDHRRHLLRLWITLPQIEEGGKFDIIRWKSFVFNALELSFNLLKLKLGVY